MKFRVGDLKIDLFLEDFPNITLMEAEDILNKLSFVDAVLDINRECLLVILKCDAKTYTWHWIEAKKLDIRVALMDTGVDI